MSSYQREKVRLLSGRDHKLWNENAVEEMIREARGVAECLIRLPRPHSSSIISALYECRRCFNRFVAS